MKKRYLPVLVLLICSFLSLTAFAKSGYWVLSNNGRWWYQYTDGGYPANGWELIDNQYYYFDAEGWMLADTVTPDGYWVGPDGAWIPDRAAAAAASSASTSNRSGTYDFIYSDNYVMKLNGNTLQVIGNYRIIDDASWDTVATGYMDEAFQITDNTRFYEVTEELYELSQSTIRQDLADTGTFIHCRLIIVNGTIVEMILSA